MSDGPQLSVITTERRKGGERPPHRPLQRKDDMEDLQQILDRACAALDRQCEAADELTQKLAKA
jgi:hypothetical protein